jgi:hypothetical protein
MATNLHREPWNKGIIVGQKAPLKLREVWAIRMRLQLGHRARELALFNLGVDSKLRACDLLQLRVRDIYHGDRVKTRHCGRRGAPGTAASLRRSRVYGSASFPRDVSKHTSSDRVDLRH